MNSKERVLNTLKKDTVDRVPLDCWIYQKQLMQKMEKVYGTHDKFMEEFNIDIFTCYVPWPNQLGKQIEVEDLTNVKLDKPKKDFWLEYNDWNEDFCGINIKMGVDEYGNDKAVIAHIWGIIESTSTFLGIENCWANLALEKDLMRAWFDKLSDWLCYIIEDCIDEGVDIITISDDWGGNNNMLFSPNLWRELIAPYTEKLVNIAKSRGVPVNLHSDGYIYDIVPDIIDMGFNMLHPIQESAGMKPELLKKNYGDKITFYGSLDTVEGLNLFDGEELNKYIKKRFDIYAPGGGFIFNTGHFVQPEIPIDRLIYAYEMANHYSKKY